jgi:hypothetical protein
MLVAMAMFAGTFAFAAEKDAAFEGIISASVTRAGTEAMHFVFTRKGNQLRVENTTNKLEPINIVDLAANRLTIAYLHNTSFVHVDLTRKQSQAGTPPSPPSMPKMPSMPQGAIRQDAG